MCHRCASAIPKCPIPKSRGIRVLASPLCWAWGRGAVIEKIGPQGARVHLKGGEVIDVPGFPVEVTNILGAGDAFGGGFIYGLVKGWGWYKSARLGNACGAIVVTEHGCANFMPTLPEVEAFTRPYGGLA